MSEEKVLLVDDEPEFTRLLASRLESKGVHVSVADGGTSALEAIESETFDAIVLDMVMPDMDGMEVLRKLREIDPDLQIILLTGHATVKKGVEAMKLGAMDFLEKPVDFNRLMNKLREARTRKLQIEERKRASSISELMKNKGW